MVANNVDCPICRSNAFFQPDYERSLAFYDCPICGRFELGVLNRRNTLNENHLAAYLFYHKFKGCTSNNYSEYRYHTVLDKELCDTYRAQFRQGDSRYALPIHMDSEIIENWYPKTFSERIDYILLYLNSHIPHLGQQISIAYPELLSLLFVDRKEIEHEQSEWRNAEDCFDEIEYMLKYLQNSSYIDYTSGPGENECALLRLTSDGYARIDAIQKNATSGRNVLVAMKFGDDTKPLREAVRKGIIKAGYVAIFIDEVQHNNFITPELLKHIRDSKFVVVDLTHQNNGAYFEEGYAMGLGKPVIQLCKADTQLHFDIAQKNTIMWTTEDDIPERLYNRIKATID